MSDDTQTPEDRDRLDDARRSAAAAPHRGSTQTGIPPKTHGPQGTTHDPNSVTTGTEMEPDDFYPPKGDGR